MTIKMTCIIFVLTTLLGCIGPNLKKDFEFSLQAWVGKPIVDFLKTVNNDTNTSISSVKITNEITLYSITNYSIYTDVNPKMRRYELSCSKHFETNQSGTIVKAYYHGNGCW